MTFDDNFWRALQDAVLAFPTVASLGSGTPPATWLAARNAARETARAAVLITGSSSEGGSGSGQRQFDQGTVVDALDCRRFALDATYELPPHLAGFAAEKAARAAYRGRGFTLRIGSTATIG